MRVEAGTKEDSCGQRSAGDGPCAPLPQLCSRPALLSRPASPVRGSAASSALVRSAGVTSTFLEVHSWFIKGKKGQTFSKGNPSDDLMPNIVRYR